MENPRALGKREVKRTQTYIDSDLWSRSKRKRLRQAVRLNIYHYLKNFLGWLQLYIAVERSLSVISIALTLKKTHESAS